MCFCKFSFFIGFILDEGMFVMDGVFPGVDQPVAYVGVVEKGWANVELSVQGVQGHSSTPPKESAVGILAHAMAKLEDTRQPSRFGHSVEYDTMSHVAPYASFGYKLVLGNLWLFKDIVAKILSNDAKTDAIQRTTSAITVVNAGIKSNVIPNEASALVNHRIHPADSVQDVIDNDNKIIDDSRYVDHSSEIRGLCSTKCSCETLQNLFDFMLKKTCLEFLWFFISLNFTFLHYERPDLCNQRPKAFKGINLKFHRFDYTLKIANFEVFCWNISLSANLSFMKSGHEEIICLIYQSPNVGRVAQRKKSSTNSTA